MKFMVVVNQKYLVAVEAQTNGGAEHKILDDIYYGIETCQAFSMKELNTETFKYFYEKCETISLEEMKKRAEEYKKALDEKEEEEKKIKEYENLIKELETQLNNAKWQKSISFTNVATLNNTINNIW